MDKISVLVLLKKYKEWMKKDIKFLEKESPEKKEISECLDYLIEAFKKAKDDAKAKKNELSDNLDLHSIHEKGKKLWRNLMSLCLEDIDETAKGNSKLYEFIDKATDFEDILYGLERYYRDHTLHSLWVYFIGEYILREKLTNLHDNLYWYVFNDIKENDEAENNADSMVNDKKEEKESSYSKAEEKIINLHTEVNKKKDAIWCIIALCHDLGYSMSKLSKLNEKVKGVLDFFDLVSDSHVGYEFNIEHQYNITQFLELMAMDVRIVNNDEEEPKIKCIRDDSTYWRLCRALEKKQHGIYSAYLIYKVLGVFADSWVGSTADNFDEDEAVDNIIRGVILFAIAQHEFEFAHLNFIGGLAELLILADELEEFSRLGRQLLSRKYHDTMAHSDIIFNIIDNEGVNEVEITFNYEVTKENDLKKFFYRKAQRLAQVFSLGVDAKISPYSMRITKIFMKAKKGRNTFAVEMAEEAFKGALPKFKKNKKGDYILKCKDDVLTVLPEGKDPVPLSEWMIIEKVGGE